MMIKTLKLVSIVTVLFVIGSCCQPLSKKNRNSNVTKKFERIHDRQFKIDSVIVNYWKSTEANMYQFHYTKGILRINSEYFSFENKIDDKQIYEPFLVFINDLYINNEPIVLTRKEEPSPVSDYDEIEVVGFLNEQKLFENKTILYSNIEFNPIFLEFHKFLDNLIKKRG